MAHSKTLRVLVLCLGLLFVSDAVAEKARKGWGNIVDSDGGADVEYGEQTVAEKNDFSEKQYESDDPNDDEDGYTGDYNTPETDHPDTDGEEEEDQDPAQASADDDEEDASESFVQVKSKAKKLSTKKGWGNIVDSDGGADVEYGEQTVAEKNDFSEKQYESDDPNDDEDGYTGDYNTPETDHPDGEEEEEDQDPAQASADDDEEDASESFVQVKSKAKKLSAKKKGWGNIVDSDGGADVEYGEQTVAEKNDFSEKQYESDDPNDDEDGYTGDYNTPETDHPDGEEEEEEDQDPAQASADDDEEDASESFVQVKSKAKKFLASKK